MIGTEEIVTGTETGTGTEEDGAEDMTGTGTMTGGRKVNIKRENIMVLTITTGGIHIGINGLHLS
jgi:hypothetical protein